MLFALFSEYYEFDNVPMPKPWIKYSSANMDQLYANHHRGKLIWMESVKNNLAYLKEPKVKSQLLKNFQLKEEFIEMAKKTIGLFFDAIIACTLDWDKTPLFIQKFP